MRDRVGVRSMAVLVPLAIAGCRGPDTKASEAPPARVEPPTRVEPPARVEPTPPPPEATPTMPVTLDWTITPRADALHIDYQVHNGGDAPVWVVDDMLTWTAGKLSRAPSAIIVRNGAEPGLASLFRGNLNIPTHDSRMFPSPGMREVAPGATLDGAGEVALPLSAWHNYHPDKIEALRAPITRMQLELQVLPAQGTEDKDWQYETLDDGSRVASPFLRYLNERATLIQGAPRDVPVP